MEKKASDFRYNTGETKVPWAAVGEDYNAKDTMAVVRFMMQGKGADYEEAIADVQKAITKLDRCSEPPAKLSVDRMVAQAENLCDEYLHTTGATFVTNCTAGFEIAGKYANLGPGDEVIVPAITFIATMAYPLSVGCKLVFADVDPLTLNMDPADVARKITDKTKMIIPVHIGGYPVDMDPLMELARAHDILVLEDAAHAFGAKYHGKMLGTIGDFGAYSFHEVKNITSFGEGGILVTNVESFKDDMRRARFLGTDFSHAIKDWLYDVTCCQGKYGPFVAGNASTTEIQGLGLCLQLGRIDEIIAARSGHRVLKRPACRMRRARYAGSRQRGHSADVPSVPAGGRPGEGRRGCAGTQGEACGARCDEHPALWPAVSVQRTEAVRV